MGFDDIQNIDWSTVNKASYVKYEAVKGTREAAINQLGMMAFSAPAPGARQADFRQPGEKYTQAHTYEDAATTGGIEGALDYNGIEFWASLLSKPTTTNPATDVYQHVMNTSPRGADDAASFSLEWGDEETWAMSLVRAMLSEGGFSFDRDDSQFPLSGSWFGKELYHDKLRYLDAVHGGSAAGDFTISFTITDTTEPIAYDAIGADVEAALNALINIGSSGVSVTGPSGGPWVVTFDGGDVTQKDVNMLVLKMNALTGGTSPNVGIAETVPGVASTTDEEQTLTVSGSPTGGTFRLQFTDTVTTGAITYDDTAADIKTAITALGPFASADIEVLGGDLGTTPVQLFFTGNWRYRYLPAITIDETGLTDVTTSVSRLSQDYTAFLPRPVVPQDTNYYIAETQAELDSADIAAMHRMFAGEFTLGDKRGPQTQIRRNRSAYEFDTEMVPSTELTLTVGTGQADLIRRSMRRRKHFFVRMESISDEEVVAGSGYYYTHQVDMCLNVRSESASEDLDGVDGTPFTVGLFKDATWGKVVEVTMINGRSSL
jgi:hypothetical protein